MRCTLFQVSITHYICNYATDWLDSMGAIVILKLSRRGLSRKEDPEGDYGV